MTRWEYKELHFTAPNLAQPHIADAGRDGWEMFFVMWQPQTYIYFFKRPLPDMPLVRGVVSVAPRRKTTVSVSR